MLRKTMMLAMAVTAVAAVAGPSMASAQVWTHHTQAIQSNAQIFLTGQAAFNGGLGGIECQTTASLTALAGQKTGNVTQFEPDPDAAKQPTELCKTSGALSFCQVHSAQSTNLPWEVHNETTRVEITSGDIHVGITGAFCPGQVATVTPANAALGHTVTATPNQPKTITSFTLSGKVDVDILNGQQTVSRETVTVSGTQTIEEKGAGSQSRQATYSISN